MKRPPKGRSEHTFCTGKVPFPNPSSAAKAAKALEKRESAKRHHGLKPYRCCCGNWHLGRPDRPNLRKEKRRAIREGGYESFA